MEDKPQLATKQIWNINLGFLGLQIAFSLIMTNTSRIFSALGANTDLLSILWLAPPLAGLIIQPIIGYWSDRMWTRFGRRIPFIFVGSILASVLLVLIPNLSSFDHIIYPIWDEVILLFLLQAAFNMALLPFRALIGDQLNTKQQNKGFSIQTFICNTGAILGALLPFSLAFGGMRNEPFGDERLAPTTSWSFYLGSILLLVTVLWTCLKTKEYHPEKYQSHSKDIESKDQSEESHLSSRKVFFQLGIIQFFSWIGFFFLWVYATDGIAQKVWNTNNPLSQAYNEAGNWFGVLTGVYSIVSIITVTFLDRLTARFGRKHIYFISLICCSIGFLSMYFIDNQYLLLVSMVGIGVGWAGILTFPFSIMTSNTPPHRMGFQMGLLNATITLPQIVGAFSGMVLFRYLADSDSIMMIVYAGISLLVAALCVLFLQDKISK